MQELNTLSEVAERFDNIDGIEAQTHDYDERALVKVMDESAIGDFFKICREHDLSRSATSRKHLEHTVMDSWVDL